MANAFKLAIVNGSRDMQAQSRRESKAPSTVFVAPKTRDVNTLADWIADHPDAKQSKSLRRIMETYYATCGVAITHDI